MLQQVMGETNNYFVKTRHSGVFTIAGGVISLPFLLEGQRFKIEGSALNNGVYTYHAEGIKSDDDTDAAGLHDETWTGTICALAVPPAVIALSAEIKSWVDTYGSKVESPYASENMIGVYSYTMATGGSGAGGAVRWQDVFRDRLKSIRKVSRL